MKRITVVRNGSIVLNSLIPNISDVGHMLRSKGLNDSYKKVDVIDRVIHATNDSRNSCIYGEDVKVTKFLMVRRLL